MKKKAVIQLPVRVMCPASGTWCPSKKCILDRLKTKQNRCYRKFRSGL
jgi:hypothetical protein